MPSITPKLVYIRISYVFLNLVPTAVTTGDINASAINQHNVKVFEHENSSFTELLTEANDTLLLSNVQSQFPNATGLKFKTMSNSWQSIRLDNGVFYPPPNGWNDVYITIG